MPVLKRVRQDIVYKLKLLQVWDARTLKVQRVGFRGFYWQKQDYNHMKLELLCFRYFTQQRALYVSIGSVRNLHVATVAQTGETNI